jgi:hypothetical protein
MVPLYLPKKKKKKKKMVPLSIAEFITKKNKKKA